MVSASRSASGHLEWADPSQALNALAACNHYVIRDAGITVVIIMWPRDLRTRVYAPAIFTYASRSLYRSISFKETKELFPAGTVVTGR